MDKLESACMEALKQIEDRRYAEELQDLGMKNIFKYGIACCQKRCRVALERE